jgi:hypothetical protein
MNKLLITFFYLLVAFSSSANAGTKPKEQGRKLTGYECARMERLVTSTAEILGMGKSGYWDLLEAAEKQSEFPEAFHALRSYLIVFKNEVLIRNQYELQQDFTRKCAAGKIRISASK